MPYEPLPSFFPIALDEVEEEDVVAPPAMPYVPTSVPTPPPPSGGIVVPPSMVITDGQRLVTEQLQDESSMDGVQQSGGMEIGEQQIEVQQSGELQIGEEQIGDQQMVDQQPGEQQTGEPQTGEQEMWGIRDGGRVLVSGTTTAPLRRSTRITRGVPPQFPGKSAEGFARPGEWGAGARDRGNGGKASAGEEADEDSVEAAWWDVAAVQVLISDEAFQRWLDEPAGDGGQLFPLPSTQSHGTPNLPPSAFSAPSKPSPSSNSPLSPPPSSPSAPPHPSPSHHPPSASGHPCASPHRLVLFSANDYLGLASHPRVRAAAAKAAWQQGMGPRASALVTGFTTEHEGLEHDIARLKGTQACLLCPTGFAANLVVLASLAPVPRAKGNHSSNSRNGSDSNDRRENVAIAAGSECAPRSENSSSSSGSFRGSGGGRSVGHGQGQIERVEEGRVDSLSSMGDSLAVFSDELNHASIIDALRLLLPRTERGAEGGRAGVGAGGAAVALHVYRHNDMTHLDELLMDGDFAPLPALVSLKAKRCYLFVLIPAL
ncbi:unnamed protein product [Closterium sp. Naga37s-1]|nr:unnamed protein product [Closterium sp. Naga37s-1]